MSNVFFSYARADAEIVSRIANDLNKQSVSVWLDQDSLRAGDSWIPQIEKAISEAEFLLVFISEHSNASEYVQSEYHYALQAQEKSGGSRIIPVLLEKVELPLLLSRIQYVDFTESYYEGMQQLLRALSVSAGPRPKELVDVPDLAKQVAGEVAKLLGLEKTTIGSVQESSSSKVVDVDSNLVFVIISYNEDMEPIYEGIKAAGETFGLNVQRVKDVPGDYRITNKIIDMITSARFVVADLTYERPNVYFELGFARGSAKTVVTIARQGTAIHFDVKDWTYISYTDSRTLERDLKKRFEYELGGTSI